MDVLKPTFCNHKGYRQYGKRVADIIFALILALPACLIIVLCAIAVQYETKGSPFFVQERSGYRGKSFKIFKLRTMIVETERNGVPLSDIERLTRTGRLIRTLSLDELPQIVNILKGEMSFIGPRPLLTSYVPLYSKEQMRRHDVRPGISGWAQVNGRNEIDWEQRFNLDLWYVDHARFGLDFVIFLMTIFRVLTRKGVNAEAGDTMRLFQGSGSIAG